MSVPIGIDLGSTCCRLAVAGEYSGDDFATPSWCPGYSLILDHGAPVPSVIAGTAQGPPFDDRGDILVGRHALHQENQFRLDITRLLAGRTSADREQIAVLTQLLKHLRILAEKNLHQDVAEAVVGIPATFKYQDLQPIVEASKLAGFAAIKRLSQPAATALACFWGDTSQLRQILVYDFGGTKFEAAVVEIVNDNAMILSTAVDQHLGGRDLDERLAVWIEEQLRNMATISARSIRLVPPGSKRS